MTEIKVAPGFDPGVQGRILDRRVKPGDDVGEAVRS
jgi:hypothetical protein